MSLNSRIKERREQLNLSRNELAERIGVTPSAIANYENAISSPKIELMYRLFDALECDANYLYQDEMRALTYKDKATPEEFDTIIKKYRDLDDHGRDMVDTVLDKEWQRSTAEGKAIKPISITEARASKDLEADAANQNPDATPEQTTFDDDVMDDPNF